MASLLSYHFHYSIYNSVNHACKRAISDKIACYCKDCSFEAILFDNLSFVGG